MNYQLMIQWIINELYNELSINDINECDIAAANCKCHWCWNKVVNSTHAEIKAIDNLSKVDAICLNFANSHLIKGINYLLIFKNLSKSESPLVGLLFWGKNKQNWPSRGLFTNT